MAIVPEFDLRSNVECCVEDERLALLGLLDLDLRLVERQDCLLDERVAVGVLDEVIHRVLEHGAGAEHPIEHEAGRLPGPEARHLRAPREMADGGVDRSRQPLRWQLDVELDRAPGAGRGGHVHGPPSLPAAPRSGERSDSPRRAPNGW